MLFSLFSSPSHRGPRWFGVLPLVALVGSVLASGAGMVRAQSQDPNGVPAAPRLQDPSDSVPDVAREDIGARVAELASSRFDVREEAMRRLSQLGADQIPLLEGELKLATDVEVRVRLAAVLAKLKHERQQRTVRTFLRDPDMSRDHGLHGWASFSRVAGANRSAKRLFLQLGDRYGELIETALEPGEPAMEWARRVARDIQDDQLALREGDKSDGLALLYCLCAAQDPNGNVDEERGTLASLSVRMFARAPYNQFFRDPQAKKPIETMTERWATTIEDTSDQARMMLGLIEADLGSAASVARKLLSIQNGPDVLEPDDALVALQIMFRYGKQEDIPILEPWLECRKVGEKMESFNIIAPDGLNPVPNNALRNTLTVELRDAAVLACMQIAGMDYRKYFPSIDFGNPRGYVLRTIAEAADADALREARIQAWRKSGFGSSASPAAGQ